MQKNIIANYSQKVCASLALVGGLFLSAQSIASADTVSGADRAFVAKVSQGGMFEVAAGRLAASQGQTQDIRDLGNTEQHDHMLVGAKLVGIIEPLGIKHHRMLNEMFSQELSDLRALSGVEFDRAFVRDMNDIHEKDGAAFAEEATNGTNGDLRAFARETHRIVERHLGALHAIDQ